MIADPARYGRTARALHWGLATFILGLTGLGAWMVTLDYYDMAAAPALHWHRALGMAALALAVLSLVQRLTASHPPPLPTWRRWEHYASTGVHAALFALMIVTPATGYLVSTAAGHGVPILDGWQVPALSSIPPALRPSVDAGHAAAAYTMLVLIALHVTAALKHHLIDRDATLLRMLTGRVER